MACLRGSAAQGAGALRQAKTNFAEANHSHKEARCFKLYELPGTDYFEYRECYDITYHSVQMAHEFDMLYKHIADEMGTPFESVKDALGSGTPGRRV
jgi:hypothetical protein